MAYIGVLLSRDRGKLTAKTPSTAVSQNWEVAECTPAPLFCMIMVVTATSSSANAHTYTCVVRA